MIAILLDAAEPFRCLFAGSSSLHYQHSYASLWRSRP
jgi:hypothetical protein